MNRAGEINAIFAAFDTDAPTVLLALGKIDRLFPVGDRRHTVVVGIGGYPMALKAITAGMWDGSAYESVSQFGPILCKYIARYRKTGNTGLKPKTTVTVLGRPVNRARIVLGAAGLELLTSTLIVTRDNAKSPDLWGNQLAKFGP